MSISHLKKVNQSQKEDKEGQCPKKMKIKPQSREKETKYRSKGVKKTETHLSDQQQQDIGNDDVVEKKLKGEQVSQTYEIEETGASALEVVSE